MPINNVFDMGAGPDLKGTWKNYRTGEVLAIRDTLFEDNHLVGVTTSGQMISYDKLQSFVKCDPSEANDKTVLKKPEKHHAPAKQFVDNISNDSYGGGFRDADPLRTPLKPHADVKQADIRDVIPELEVPTSNPDVKVTDPSIIKVLDGLTKAQQPKIKIDIKWDEVPEGIMFLKKYLGISTEEIINVCCERFVNSDDILDEISKKLKDIINTSLETPKKESVKDVNKKPKSK